ncbi:MAG: LamG-like jellyroll fold domain-containing protein, partial [Candidatus Roizmanbacteria bacterium]
AEGVLGWNGTSPTGKTPVGYEVRKSDYQISGASMSWGAWIKRSSIGVGCYILRKDDTLPIRDIRVTGDNKFQFGIDYNVYATTSTTVTDTTSWHLVVAVYNRSDLTARIFVDGVESGSSTGVNAFSDNFGAFSIAQNFPGSIDEPFVTTEVLTAGQIFEMYNSGR